MDNEKILFSNPHIYINTKTIAFDAASNYRGLHIHNEAELIYITRGSIQCTINNKMIHMKEGSIILINSMVLHSLSYCGQDAACTYMQIDINHYLDLMFPDDKNIHSPTLLLKDKQTDFITFTGESELHSLFFFIQQELNNKQPYYNEYIKSYIFNLLAFMLRNKLMIDKNELQNAVGCIYPALEFIECNYMNKINLEEISNIVHLSKYYFCKAFKKATGLTFTNYVNYLRIHHAEALLLNTQKNIADIYLECGFSSPQQFNKQFKERTSYTPREYRNLTH